MLKIVVRIIINVKTDNTENMHVKWDRYGIGKPTNVICRKMLSATNLVRFLLNILNVF